MIPQIILLTLLLGSLAFNASKHGEPRNDKYDFWVSLIGFFLLVTILTAGGFWNVFFI